MRSDIAVEVEATVCDLCLMTMTFGQALFLIFVLRLVVLFHNFIDLTHILTV